MQTLTVELGARSYPIHIGQGILTADNLKPHIHGHQVMVVSNDTVAPLYLDALKSELSKLNLAKVDEVILPDGERYKNLDHLNRIFDALLKCKHNRSTTLIALGGGVIGDMTGFAAACYQRGVPFIQIPTTLLAQVDSSVGGKTAVNHPLGKNMIGAFYQPQLVLADTDVLSTLPDREISAGLAEVIKYGLIYEAPFFDWLEANIEELRQLDTVALSRAIHTACRIKADVVAKDETEQGIRAWLNLGHTFGHAIENAEGYGVWLHGEAVGTGTVMAADLSRRLGWITSSDYGRICNLIAAAGLPLNPPADMTAERFLELMAVDKKVMDGELRLVLLKALGLATVTADFDHNLLLETLNAEKFLGAV